jgi:hypothetical protein
MWILETYPGPLQGQEELLIAERSLQSQCPPPWPPSERVLTEGGLLCYKQHAAHIQERAESVSQCAASLAYIVPEVPYLEGVFQDRGKLLPESIYMPEVGRDTLEDTVLWSWHCYTGIGLPGIQGQLEWCIAIREPAAAYLGMVYICHYSFHKNDL